MGHTASDTDTLRQICFIATVQMQGTEEVPAEFFCGIFRKRKISQIFTGVFAIVNKKAAYLKRDKRLLAGVEGFEPSARGFGDRCSTN